MLESYRGGVDGRVESDGSGSGSIALRHSFESVEERLVEAWGFMRRMPGGGRSPFAADAPWYLFRRERTDHGGHLDDEDKRLVAEVEVRGRGGLRAAEVDRMNEALDWVTLMRADDVRIVALAVAAIDRGGSVVPWQELAPKAGVRTRTGRLLGGNAVRMRYERAIARVVKALNARKSSVPRVKGQ